MLESVKLKQRFKSVNRAKTRLYNCQNQTSGNPDQGERQFLKYASTNPSGIYNGRNRDLLPQIANSKMMRKLNNALNQWSPDVRHRVSSKDADLLFLKQDRKVPPQLSDSNSQRFKISSKRKAGSGTIELHDRDHTKFLEQQMVDTINKIDVGLSKRFNPKLILLRPITKLKSVTPSQNPNFYNSALEHDLAMRSIQNVDDHLS